VIVYGDTYTDIMAKLREATGQELPVVLPGEPEGPPGGERHGHL